MNDGIQNNVNTKGEQNLNMSMDCKSVCTKISESVNIIILYRIKKEWMNTKSIKNILSLHSVRLTTLVSTMKFYEI